MTRKKNQQDIVKSRTDNRPDGNRQARKFEKNNNILNNFLNDYY